MDFKEAIKKVQGTRKAKENFMVFTLGCDFKLVIPYKDGLLLIAGLAAAEQLEETYGGKNRIGYLDRSKVTITPMSQEEYEQHKIAGLLDLTLAEVRENMLQDSQ